MISDKVVLKKSIFGKGLFAGENIRKNEVVLIFEGRAYEAGHNSDLPRKIKNHVIQFGKHRWLYPKDEARFINHSCEPNCGIKGLFKIVAMRNIKKGEELTYDYDTTENSDWTLECKCGSPSCRKIIRGYRYLPEKLKRKYQGYISAWLTGQHHSSE